MPWQTHGRTREERPARILVVEASYDVRMVIADVVTADGHQMKSVASAADALALLEESEYDLILSDLTMPRMLGAVLFREIARRWPHLVPRLICLAGEAFSTNEQDVLAAASVPMLRKPFTAAALREVVREKLAGA